VSAEEKLRSNEIDIDDFDGAVPVSKISPSRG